MRVVTFKVEADLLELLDVYAVNHRISRSEAIRTAIEKLVKEEDPVPPAKIEKLKL